MRVQASKRLVLCVCALSLVCAFMLGIGGQLRDGEDLASVKVDDGSVGCCPSGSDYGSSVLCATEGAESSVREVASEPAVTADRIEIDGATRAAGVTDDWFGKVLAQIERDEYNASVNERVLQAPNRAQNLRTYFEDGGIEVVPRTGEAEPSWSFEWRTTRWGREGELADLAGVVGSAPADGPSASPLPAGTPVANGCRVTYDRGELEEWYENKKEGLEQGFVVKKRPGSEGFLCIEGVIGGGLRAELSSDGGAIDLVDESGVRVLRYAELQVWDAGGREVPSYLRLDGSTVALLLDDVS